MHLLFGFCETLEVVTNDVPELVQKANDGQRVTHKDAKKKDCKVALCIQRAVNTINFGLISHVESAIEA